MCFSWNGKLLKQGSDLVNFSEVTVEVVSELKLAGLSLEENVVELPLPLAQRGHVLSHADPV